MAFLAVTYTFANSTTADATQVNTNFTDVINATSDGTKDLNMNAATFAGALVANGNITLGNASADDLTVNASLASSIPVKTTRTYDVGSADLGLKIVYLGGNSTHTSALQAPSSGMSGDVNFVVPPTNGTSKYVLRTDGSGTTTWEALASSYVFVDSGNGRGSSSTAIRRFTNTTSSAGSDITYADSSTLGGTFTINRAGIYSISYTELVTDSAREFGISLNASGADLTTSVNSIAVAKRLVSNDTPGSGFRAHCSVTAVLAVNDVIRAHVLPTSGNFSTGALVQFSIVQVAAL